MVTTTTSYLSICVCVCVKILNKERELDALKTRNEHLEAQIRDAVEKYKKKEEDLQVTGMMCHCIYLYSLRLFTQ